MTIICKAYLFEPSNFATAVAPYVTAIKEDRKRGYGLLCAAVIDLFEHNPNVERISLNYGAYDIEGVREAVAEDNSSQSYIGWMLSFLLYGQFHHAKPYNIGGTNSTRLLRQYLLTIGWDERDTLLLVEGRSFVEFSQMYIYSSTEVVDIPDYWKHVYPTSTGASEGWLSPSDVERLAARLVEDEKKLPPAKRFGIPNFGMKSILEDYQSTKLAYLAAREAGCGLCIICSG